MPFRGIANYVCNTLMEGQDDASVCMRSFEDDFISPTCECFAPDRISIVTQRPKVFSNFLRKILINLEAHHPRNGTSISSRASSAAYANAASK